MKKLIPVTGDILHDDLGIEKNQLQQICDEVIIISYSSITLATHIRRRSNVRKNRNQTVFMIIRFFQDKVGPYNKPTVKSDSNLRDFNRGNNGLQIKLILIYMRQTTLQLTTLKYRLVQSCR